MPRSCNKVSEGSAVGFYLAPSFGACEVFRLHNQTSLLNHCFNNLWATALNMRQADLTHFAMIHSDIAPPMGWLDQLIEEQQRVGADILSAVVPIKDAHGLTSTAVGMGDPWRRRRLSMKEVYGLPETFNANDVGGPLLVNTGLWVCDFTKPWVEDFHFECRDRIRRRSDGEFVSEVIPEDWLASQRWNELGLSVWATRKVLVRHDGEGAYENGHAWGLWDRDEVFHRNEGKSCD